MYMYMYYGKVHTVYLYAHNRLISDSNMKELSTDTYIIIIRNKPQNNNTITKYKTSNIKWHMKL